MDILDDMGVSKLSAKVFFKSELLKGLNCLNTAKSYVFPFWIYY